eukprot:SAG31_NODE_3494_length_4199_cov_7.453415_1_plen_683_part_00
MVRLLTNRADVNLRSRSGATPLFDAAAKGHVLITRQLLAFGADVNQGKNNGTTPLCVAAAAGHELVVAELLQAGANTELAVFDGFAPLYKAAQAGRAGTTRQLVEAGAAVNRASHDGSTALLAASYIGHEKVVEVLVDWPTVAICQGCVAPDGKMYTPASAAAAAGHAQVVEILHRAAFAPLVGALQKLCWSRIVQDPCCIGARLLSQDLLELVALQLPARPQTRTVAAWFSSSITYERTTVTNEACAEDLLHRRSEPSSEGSIDPQQSPPPILFGKYHRVSPRPSPQRSMNLTCTPLSDNDASVDTDFEGTATARAGSDLPKTLMDLSDDAFDTLFDMQPAHFSSQPSWMRVNTRRHDSADSCWPIVVEDDLSLAFMEIDAAIDAAVLIRGVDDEREDNVVRQIVHRLVAEVVKVDATTGGMHSQESLDCGVVVHTQSAPEQQARSRRSQGTKKRDYVSPIRVKPPAIISPGISCSNLLDVHHSNDTRKCSRSPAGFVSSLFCTKDRVAKAVPSNIKALSAEQPPTKLEARLEIRPISGPQPKSGEQSESGPRECSNLQNPAPLAPPPMPALRHEVAALLSPPGDSPGDSSTRSSYHVKSKTHHSERTAAANKVVAIAAKAVAARARALSAVHAAAPPATSAAVLLSAEEEAMIVESLRQQVASELSSPKAQLQSCRSTAR